MKRRNKVEGGIEPGKGITFTPSRVPAKWMDDFNQLMEGSQLNRTQLIVEMITKGLKAHQAERAGALILTPREQQLIMFMRRSGLSDHEGDGSDLSQEQVSIHKTASAKHEPQTAADNDAMDQLKQQLKGIQM